ncbi:hypothetical protein NM688_g307 [Phlebia brevispora]|uniref:Uncharacterized protein n=1 Tax=Phlebia brevispora TaxID=194682 RepID=A0ACC1TEP4_9APHY|nr:hypothetical protein NM688_g307 [Phlebia brevispora]
MYKKFKARRSLRVCDFLCISVIALGIPVFRKPEFLDDDPFTDTAHKQSHYGNAEVLNKGATVPKRNHSYCISRITGMAPVFEDERAISTFSTLCATNIEDIRLITQLQTLYASVPAECYKKESHSVAPHLRLRKMMASNPSRSIADRFMRALHVLHPRVPSHAAPILPCFGYEHAVPQALCPPLGKFYHKQPHRTLPPLSSASAVLASGTATVPLLGAQWTISHGSSSLSMDNAASANGVEPNVTTVLQQMTKQLQLITEQLSAMQSSDKHGAKGNEDTVDVELQEQEKAWETVVDTLKDREKRTTDSWKDELGNLLIFTGLFSAIVTAFTVLSLTWLQQDPGDATNMFLAHMSLQFSSFVVSPATTETTGYVNSSLPALSLQNVTSSFVPPSYAVPVNVLWLLSLTLSLIAAFFAIAVQQWLRQLEMPPGISLRKAAQLLSLRYSGLLAWQVPGITVVLPLLLQIAVVLFIVGLFILCRALDHTVTTVFGVVAAVALVVFLLMSLAPLISIRCPYKSPLIPTVLVVLQWISYPFYIISLPILTIALLLYIPIARHFNSDALDKLLIPVGDKVFNSLATFGKDTFIKSISEFWISRECRNISRLADNVASDLEGSALLETVLLVPSSSFSTVLRCLKDLDPMWLPTIFVKATQRGIHGVRSRNNRHVQFALKWPPAQSFRIWSTEDVPVVEQWFSVRQCRLGWHFMQRHWDGKPTLQNNAALYLFNDLSKVFTITRLPFASHVLRTCAIREIDSSDDQGMLGVGMFPAHLLLDIVQDSGTSGAIDSRECFAFMTRCSDLDRQYSATAAFDRYDIRLCFAYNASAFAFMVSRPDVFRALGLEMIDGLNHLLHNPANVLCLTNDLSIRYTNPDVLHPQLGVSLIGRAICKALADLVNTHRDTLLRGGADSPAVRLATALRSVLVGPNGEVDIEAMKYLESFDSVKKAHTPVIKKTIDDKMEAFMDQLDKDDDAASINSHPPYHQPLPPPPETAEVSPWLPSGYQDNQRLDMPAPMQRRTSVSPPSSLSSVSLIRPSSSSIALVPSDMADLTNMPAFPLSVLAQRELGDEPESRAPTHGNHNDMGATVYPASGPIPTAGHSQVPEYPPERSQSIEDRENDPDASETRDIRTGPRMHEHPEDAMRAGLHGDSREFTSLSSHEDVPNPTQSPADGADLRDRYDDAYRGIPPSFPEPQNFRHS